MFAIPIPALKGSPLDSALFIFGIIFFVIFAEEELHDFLHPEATAPSFSRSAILASFPLLLPAIAAVLIENDQRTGQFRDVRPARGHTKVSHQSKAQPQLQMANDRTKTKTKTNCKKKSVLHAGFKERQRRYVQDRTRRPHTGQSPKNAVDKRPKCHLRGISTPTPNRTSYPSPRANRPRVKCK